MKIKTLDFCLNNIFLSFTKKMIKSTASKYSLMFKKIDFIGEKVDHLSPKNKFNTNKDIKNIIANFSLFIFEKKVL